MSTHDWLAPTLADFGKQLGFRNLALSEKGIAQFCFQDRTTVTFELREEQFSIVLTRPVPYAEGTQKRRALEAADIRPHGGPALVSAWGPNDTLVLISTQAASDVTTPLLDNRLRNLIATADWVVNG